MVQLFEDRHQYIQFMLGRINLLDSLLASTAKEFEYLFVCFKPPIKVGKYVL